MVPGAKWVLCYGSMGYASDGRRKHPPDPLCTHMALGTWTHGPILYYGNRLQVVSCCFTCYIQHMQSTIGKPAQEFRDFAAEARAR